MKVKSILFLSILLVGLLAVLPFSLLQVPEAKAQSEEWTVIERGFNFIRRQNVANPGLFSWESAPCWVWDGSDYVPYIYTETANYYQIQSGLIGARIYKAGYAEFYSPDMSEVRLYEETWEVQYYSKSWKVCDTYSPQLTVSTDETTVNVTASFVTDWPNSGERAFTVKYIFREGSPLKHEVTFTSYSIDIYDFRVVQKWAGIVGDNVKHDKGENVITSATVINSSWFEFQKEDRSLSVFENQWSMYYDEFGEILSNQNLKPVEIDVHAQGMKADFVFSNWTLTNGEELTIDPSTTTYYYTNADAFVDNGYPTTNYGSDIYLRAVYNYPSAGVEQKSYLKFDISSLPSGIDITFVTLRLRTTTVFDPGDVGCYSVVSDDWTESGITWNNSPEIGTVQDTQNVVGTGDYFWTVTDYVESEYADDKIVSFAFKATISVVGISFASKEYDSYDPRLAITYTYLSSSFLIIFLLRIFLPH